MKDLLHGKPSSLALPYRRAAQQWRFSTGIDQPATGYADDSDIPRGHPMTETILPEQDCDQSEFIDLSIGWAAVRRGAVVAFIPMRNFQDVDFERFREESRWLLAMLGSVKAGNLMRKPDGSIVFLARRAHDRRSTQVGRPRPEFPVAFLEPRFHPEQ